MAKRSNPEPVQRVLDAWERERSRVATGLYADVAQRLSATLLYLEVARKEARRAQSCEVARFLGTARSETERALEEVRRVARELHPQELEELGPLAALEAYARGLADGNSVKVSVEAEPLDPVIDPEAGAAIFRVLQEALVNAVRHAEACCLTIRMREMDDGGVEAVLEDDGKGFDADSALQEHGRGAGFLQMAEQAARASGQVDVDSRPGGGTRVRVRVPGKARTTA